MKFSSKQQAKLFRHNMTREYLKECLKSSVEERLDWLEEALEFIRKTLPKKFRKKR